MVVERKGQKEFSAYEVMEDLRSRGEGELPCLRPLDMAG